MLGYKWNTVEEIIKPGIGELNFNKKVRGAKKPNAKPMETVEDLRELLELTTLTKRSIASKLAEVYDPAGTWEMMKLKLKLEFTAFNGRSWDDSLTSEEKVKWGGYFEEFMKIPSISTERCVIPEDAVSTRMRLLCLADASDKAGGTCLYISFKLKDGSYSAQLLTSRSHLMDSSVPRNELKAIIMMTYTAHVTYRSIHVTYRIEKYIEDIMYFTDSRIAMCWVFNQKRRLKTYVHNRVITIRRLMKWADVYDSVPLYHIPGELNVADLLTKDHMFSVAMVDRDSTWQRGMEWMKEPIESMSVTRYEDIAYSKAEAIQLADECMEIPFVYVVLEANEQSDKIVREFKRIPREVHTDSLHTMTHKSEEEEFLVDIVTLGWWKARRRMLVYKKSVPC